MKQAACTPMTKARRLSACLGAVAAALFCLGLFTASPASATYEQVGTFAGTPGELHPPGFENDQLWPEEVQVGGLGGMAVNRTGAGGVTAGTLYAATLTGGVRVARYNPDGSFSESWTFEGSPSPQERCGPEGDSAHPICKSRPSGSESQVDIEVDQSTGYVYVFGGRTNVVGSKRIHVYSADGSELIAEFGDQADMSESIGASPAKLHQPSAYGGSMALDAAGNVYLFDYSQLENFYHRVMEFTPQSPGDYEHYVYAGQGHDVWAGSLGETPFVASLVFDGAGALYASGEEYVAKLDPSQPTAPALCEFEFPKGGIQSMTVNPASGEVFFYTTKGQEIHQLAPCEEGKFAEAGAFAFAPERRYIAAMAFDPDRQLEAGRTAGVLYGGAPSGEGGNTKKEGEVTLGESALGYVFSSPLELAPEALSQAASHVTPTTADLGAQVNPRGALTRYIFQYETETEYEANEPTERFAGAAEAPRAARWRAKARK